MLDKYIVPVLKRPLAQAAKPLHKLGISADQVSIGGFILGLLCVLMLAFNQPLIALILLLLNRLADGIDGALARQDASTDAGGFLDITLDFIFYALFPLGFAVADPSSNALAAAVLIASFVGTGASFLAFSTMAEKRHIQHPDFSYKGLYYLNGLAEGTETIICFSLMCLLPQHFALIASLFAFLCIVTAINRVVFGYLTLRRAASTKQA